MGILYDPNNLKEYVKTHVIGDKLNCFSGVVLDKTSRQNIIDYLDNELKRDSVNMLQRLRYVYKGYDTVYMVRRFENLLVMHMKFIFSYWEIGYNSVSKLVDKEKTIDIQLHVITRTR